MDKLCTSKDARGQQLDSRVFEDCDIGISKLMRHLMRHDALQEWEGQRVSRMKEYESKGTKN